MDHYTVEFKSVSALNDFERQQLKNYQSALRHLKKHLKEKHARQPWVWYGVLLLKEDGAVTAYIDAAGSSGGEQVKHFPESTAPIVGRENVGKSHKIEVGEAKCLLWMFQAHLQHYKATQA